ncbi:DUF1275 family protein [Streptomyces sp. PR69]|uniref:DUF1275 family protein n=1 Tax=Streptomyces sp. PR69 TaxID=2984950 RepID=UPI0022649CD6|nr:DUF1275 family protein [Streptomyces sp. PR69]
MVALTVTTGVVEAVSFLVLGPVFTAVQTGNLRREWSSAPASWRAPRPADTAG